MRKRLYIVPQITMVRITTQHLLVESQFDISVNNPEEEVDAGEALSRKNILWEE
jgi:hypothetical protein